MIAREGPRAFYRGELAEAIVDAVAEPAGRRRAPTTTWRPGLMTEQDLRSYEALRREPTHMTYRGLDVWGMGPPSSGGSTVGETLNILEGYSDLADGPDTRPAPLPRVLALRVRRPQRLRRRPGLLRRAARRPALGRLRGRAPRADRPGEGGDEPRSPPGNPYDDEGSPGRAEATVSHPRQSTTHLVVSDRHGTVVSYTFTIESTGGNGIVVPGYGFLLNNELTDFNYDSRTHPNRADGGKRPRSSMSPTIVTRRGEPVFAVGSPGGSTIIPTVAQVLLERLDLGASLPEAIARPRAAQRNTATTTAEPAFINSPEGQALKDEYGHSWTEMAEIGAVTGLEFLPGGRVLAAAEPVRRGGGSAAVVRP